MSVFVGFGSFFFYRLQGSFEITDIIWWIDMDL